MSSLKIKNISKTYGQLDILKNIDVNIEDGELLVLVGHYLLLQSLYQQKPLLNRGKV